MILHDTENLPNPVRVRIALAEKGASDKVELRHVDLFGGEHRSEAFRARNPDATVPCLELEDGSHLSRCNAIIEYIDGAFDGPSLIGDTPRQRAETQMMNARAEEGLLDAVGAYFHQATEGLGPELEGEQVKAWGLKGRDRAQATMRYLDGVLAKRPFLAGDAFSMADITAFAGLAFADAAKVDIPAELANLADWRARVAARPSVAGA